MAPEVVDGPWVGVGVVGFLVVGDMTVVVWISIA